MTVWRRAASFDPGRASPITWMVAIARNRAIDRLRASAVSRRMEPIESADAVSDPAPCGGRARRTGAAAPTPRRLPGGAGGAPRARHPGGIPGRHHLRGTGRAYERAARHHEELDSTWTAETQDLSRGMSTDDTMDPAAGGKLIAAEYVLGVLGAEERREVERRLAQEPALASEVAFWEERLGGIADAVAPVVPPPEPGRSIEAAIALGRPRPEPLRRCGRASRSGAVSASARPRSRPPASPRWPISGWCRRSRRPLMATLAGSSGQPNFVAAVTATGNSLVVVPAALLTNDPRAMELWLILPGRDRAAFARPDPARSADPAHHSARTRRPAHTGRGARGIARAAGRLADRPADRTGHRQRQANELVTAVRGVAVIITGREHD